MQLHELESDTDRRDAVPILRQLWSDADPDRIIDWTGEEEYHLFGRFDSDDLVGVAGVQTGNHLHHARIVWLYDLVVDESRRGEGHGTALLEHVEDWAAERDCEYVALASPLNMDAVHEYYEDREYEKWGYIVEKEL